MICRLLFSLIPKILLFFVFSKIIFFFHHLLFFLKETLLFFGLVSVLMGIFFALSQTRVKRFVLYSSIAQTGFVIIALGIINHDSFFSMYFFLLIYLITSFLIWGHSVAFYAFQSKIANFDLKLSKVLIITNLRNFFRLNSLWSFSLIVTLFSTAGIPPLTGFLAKVMILSELVYSGYLISSLILVLISSISVFYYIRILKIMIFEPKNNNKRKQHFQVIFFDYCFDTLYNLFTLSCVYFFYPTDFFIFCQYVALVSTSSVISF